MWSSAMPRANLFGHRAKILAHDDRAGAMGFERDDGVHLISVVRHIGTVSRVESLGDDVKALEPHHVIDAQIGRMAKRTASTART